MPKGICGGGWVSSVLISVLFLIHGKAPSIKNHFKYIHRVHMGSASSFNYLMLHGIAGSHYAQQKRT